MADGARTIVLTRWRTGGRTNFDLVREFVRELPNAPATEAWQRACLLARESPLEASREPRLKRSDETGELPTADHPFFWAGYLLVDTSPRPRSGRASRSGSQRTRTQRQRGMPLTLGDKDAEATLPANRKLQPRRTGTPKPQTQ